jgi:hypothetical protein
MSVASDGINAPWNYELTYKTERKKQKYFDLLMDGSDEALLESRHLRFYERLSNNE